MATFLSFLSAATAPRQSSAVCALLVAVTGCTRGSAFPAAQSLLTGPVPLAAPSPPQEREPPLALSGSSSAPQSEPGAEPASPQLAALELHLELPYPSSSRPRAADPAQAAADDQELARWNVGGSADPSSTSSQASYHPGTRVVVDTRLAKVRTGAQPRAAPRGLTLERIQAQTRAHGYWPFRLCFEAGQREKVGTGGETLVAYTISTRGKVRAARLLDSQLRSPTSAACLVREVLKLQFSPPPPRALAMVASIRIWPGDAEAPTVPTGAPIAPTLVSVFDPNSVRAQVNEKQTQLAQCFADAQRADPTLWGRLALLVITEADGSVHRVSETESRFPSPDAVRCVQVLLSTLQFPSVNGKPFSFVVAMRLRASRASIAASSDLEPDPSSTDEAARADAGSD